ncbi:MAG TPA: thioredoxin family protein [Acidimicrobiia bacterium]|nr:thioredoxin family protein [Acidimicrobiia bacterium]
MNIKVLGSGCVNCQTLEKRTAQAVQLLGLDAHIEKVTDYAAIAAYGVMTTPALVIDERVVLAGRVPKVADLQALLGGTPFTLMEASP